VSALEHPGIARAERDGIPGLSDDATVYEATGSSVNPDVAVVASRREAAVVLHVGRETLLLSTAGARRLCAALLAAGDAIEPWEASR
jgi:hypothetical protein